MKQFKIYFLAGLLTVTSWQVQAQIRYGVKSGLNVSNFHISYEDGWVSFSDYKSHAGFHIGIFSEIPLSNIFFIQPELLFSGKGVINKAEITLQTSYSDATTSRWQYTYTPYYAELPIYIKAGFKTGKAGKIVVGVGPYFACGVAGKIKVETKFETYSENDVFIESGEGKGEMNLFKKDKLEIEMHYSPEELSRTVTFIEMPKAAFKRFDTGISGFAGYELRWGLFASIGYDMGLYKIDNWSSETKFKNRTCQFSVGYKF